MRNKGKKFSRTDEAQVSIERSKRKLCEASVLGMPTEKGMFVLDTDASVVITQLMSFLGFANYYREFIRGYADKIYSKQKLMRNKGKKFSRTDEAQVSIENIKRELCEAMVLGMPTEKGMFVLDTYAPVVAISDILHQDQERNGRTVLGPITYGKRL